MINRFKCSELFVCFSHFRNVCIKFIEAHNALIIDGDVVSNLVIIVKLSRSSDWTWKTVSSAHNQHFKSIFPRINNILFYLFDQNCLSVLFSFAQKTSNNNNELIHIRVSFKRSNFYMLPNYVTLKNAQCFVAI